MCSNPKGCKSREPRKRSPRKKLSYSTWASAIATRCSRIKIMLDVLTENLNLCRCPNWMFDRRLWPGQGKLDRLQLVKQWPSHDWQQLHSAHVQVPICWIYGARTIQQLLARIWWKPLTFFGGGWKIFSCPVHQPRKLNKRELESQTKTWCKAQGSGVWMECLKQRGYLMTAASRRTKEHSLRIDRLGGNLDSPIFEK